eukprot:Pgem_evm2s5238
MASVEVLTPSVKSEYHNNNSSTESDIEGSSLSNSSNSKNIEFNDKADNCNENSDDSKVNVNNKVKIEDGSKDNS